MIKVLISFFILFTNAHALTIPNIPTGTKNKVLVFLSKTCPCTQENIPYVNDLVKAYPQFEFIGVHSVKGATLKDIEELKKTYKPQFDVIEDHELKIANALKANRTPQSFILTADNIVLYNGGITDRTNPFKASAFYLKNALSEVSAGETITQKETRSLGCVILR